MKRFVTKFFCVAMVIGLILSMSVAGIAKEKNYTLKVGMVVTETDPMYKGAIALKTAVEKRTKGNLKIQIFPSSQLGDTADILEQAKVGADVAVIVDPGRLADFVPAIGIFGAPYIVKDYEEGKRLTQTKLFKGWETELATKHGIRILSFDWFQGDRHLLLKKPVLKPADLKGVRMRSSGSEVVNETIRAMGAEPTPLAWSEVYTGLQQKVIDGAEAQYPAVYGAHLYEVITHVVKTSHFQLVTGLATGSKWFNSLPKHYQKILLEESVKAGDYASRLTISSLNEYEANMKKEGVKIVEIDTTPFKKATEAVYNKIKGYRELRQQVNKALNK
jgi:tripartite ATP-independent transporter DctP family solute receptor